MSNTEAAQDEPKVNDLSSQYVAFLKQLSSQWSSYIAARMLTPELINYIRPRFHRCSTPIKVRILISFLHISPELLKMSSTSLSELLKRCETDRDDWVRKLSRLLQPYVATGCLNLRDIDTETAYRTIKFLDEYRHVTQCEYRLKPLHEHSHVFNVVQDTPPPFDQPTAPHGPCPPNAFENLWCQILDTHHVNLPKYPASSGDFVSGGDFSSFAHSFQLEGLMVLVRELQGLRQQKNGHLTDPDETTGAPSDFLDSPHISPR